jgi:hypothetical protein
VSFVVGGALDWLAERLQPSGDAAIRGLEEDLSRQMTLDGCWWRICDTAWALAFVELRLAPTEEGVDLLAERHNFAPRPWPSLDREDGQPAPQSTWAFHLTAGGRVVATLTARRRLGRVDFEPLQFLAAVQGVIDRFVHMRSGDLPAAAPHEPATKPRAALELTPGA